MNCPLGPRKPERACTTFSGVSFLFAAYDPLRRGGNLERDWNIKSSIETTGAVNIRIRSCTNSRLFKITIYRIACIDVYVYRRRKALDLYELGKAFAENGHRRYTLKIVDNLIFQYYYNIHQCRVVAVV